MKSPRWKTTIHFALIVLFLVVFLSPISNSMATDARLTQSAAYWHGEARPFSISEFWFPSNDSSNASSTGKLVIMNNKDSPSALTLTDISLGCNNETSVYHGGRLTLQPGETQTVEVTVGGLKYVGEGSVYDFCVNITFELPNGSVGKQNGLRPIVGKYGPEPTDPEIVFWAILIFSAVGVLILIGLLVLFWKKIVTKGSIAGVLFGLAVSLALIITVPYGARIDILVIPSLPAAYLVGGLYPELIDASAGLLVILVLNSLIYGFVGLMIEKLFLCWKNEQNKSQKP